MITHPDSETITLNCAVITISDTRTVATDKSDQIIQQLLQDVGYNTVEYAIIKDEIQQIQAWLLKLDTKDNIDGIIVNGGTGIAPRDTTYDVISGWP